MIGSSSYKTLPPSTAPALSPSSSMDESSPTSSNSEPLSPERVGMGGEASKQQQRRKKKKRKGHDDVYDFLDSQENNISQSYKHGMLNKCGQEAGEDEDEGENWEWEIRESGGGGRVKSKKSKSRARLPEEWGAPQHPISPMVATDAPTGARTADSGPSVSKALISSPGPVLPSSTAQKLTGFTNLSHVSIVTNSTPPSYEPMCINNFSTSSEVGKIANQEKVSVSKPEPSGSSASSAANKSGIAGDVCGSLVLLTGDNLSPVSQTFSFLDSVLQTPPGSTPDSQTTTPITNTPSLAAAALTKSSISETPILASQGNAVLNPSKNTPDLPPTTAFSASPLLLAAAITDPPTFASGSVLNANAKPFVPTATPISTAAAAPTGPTATENTSTSAVTPLSTLASPYKTKVTPTSPLDTPSNSVATPTILATATPPPSITPTAPSSFPAHSEHQESSSSQLPSLEGW